MSLSGSITINTSSNKIFQNIYNVLKCFNNSSWKYIYNETITYIDIGNDFNWKSENYNSFLNDDIISAKTKNKEIVGILFYFAETDIGIDVLIYPTNNKISFGLDRNRKTIDYSLITDYSWYLKRIKPVLDELNIVIHSIECLDG